MAHILYEVAEDGSYKRVNDIRPFSGFNGVFFPALKDKKAVWNNSPPYKWELTEEEILIYVPRTGEGTNKYAIVFDIKPSSDDEILLLRLRKMWGFTDDIWTSLLLKLELLYEIEADERDPEKFKLGFPLPEAPERKTIFEFLYLRGGFKGGEFTAPWTWGSVGSVNGALLYPDALDYFLKIIDREKRNPAGAP